MKNLTTAFFLTLFWLIATSDVQAQKTTLADYNVQWTTPGLNSQGSMPIGNGDIGANVWVEENGDLVFYISKTDAWSENGRLLKLGEILVLDHVEASIVKRDKNSVTLKVTYPTPYDAQVAVFSENTAQVKKPLGMYAYLNWKKIEIKAGQTGTFVIKN